MHRKFIPIYIQQDATLHSLFISGNCSTCFGRYHHPSSGAQTNVSTVSGIFHTVTATCFYSGTYVWQIADAVDTVVCAPDDGWWYRPKHVQQFPDINKLCNFASCWVNIRILLRCTDPWTLNSKYLPYVILNKSPGNNVKIASVKKHSNQSWGTFKILANYT